MPTKNQCLATVKHGMYRGLNWHLGLPAPSLRRRFRNDPDWAEKHDIMDWPYEYVSPSCSVGKADAVGKMKFQYALVLAAALGAANAMKSLEEYEAEYDYTDESCERYKWMSWGCHNTGDTCAYDFFDQEILCAYGQE
ncbi:hypothetical protein PLICBS_004433 [Purpureocillium lilacinum]|uniref:uncharacterized protein n=1 Tax=Purpureocillium lilacinum TaxID=33203 RepID=UPI0020808A50|nr:hypothetical protein PLICBS_004433 [Purpureocillium lilacinum]